MAWTMVQVLILSPAYTLLPTCPVNWHFTLLLSRKQFDLWRVLESTHSLGTTTLPHSLPSNKPAPSFQLPGQYHCVNGLQLGHPFHILHNNIFLWCTIQQLQCIKLSVCTFQLFCSHSSLLQASSPQNIWPETYI